MVGLNRQTLAKAIRKGQMPGQVLDGRIIVPRAPYERFLQSGDWEPRPALDPAEIAEAVADRVMERLSEALRMGG